MALKWPWMTAPWPTAAHPSATNTTPTRVEGEDFSGTNNQEAGVDEADFVKTDGYHIYYLQGNQPPHLWRS